MPYMDYLSFDASCDLNLAIAFAKPLSIAELVCR